jgi:hypothetical protein
MHIDQTGGGGFRPTFDAAHYEGLDGKDVDVLPGRYTVYTFEHMASGKNRLIGHLTGDIA